MPLGRTKEDNKEKRKAQFLAAQATLPPEQRLGHQDRDWEEHVFRQWSLAHEAAILVTKEGFLDFLTDPDYTIGLAPEEAARYFQKNGKPATTAVLRKWLECEAYRRPGRRKGDKLHYNTLHSHIDKLCLLLKRAQNPMDEGLSRELHAWIDASLVPRGLLSTESPLKQVAMPADLTLLRNNLFQPDYMSTFADCRSPLQFALFLSLVVDCSGRAGELVASSNKKTDNNKHLKWSQIAFFAFPSPAGVTVRANVTFGDLKDKTFNPSKYKVTPLRLLPLSLAGEDSLRMLLVSGLIDGVFRDLTTWDDIQKLRPGPNGTQIKLKQAALQLPLFRHVKNNQVTQDPLRYHWIATELIRLSRHLGLPSYLICTTLRRGAAYLLAMNTTKEERCARMGHSDSDTTYWSHYRNEISTFDFQAIVHGVQAEDMTMHSSVTLGSALANAPRRLSKKGYEEMFQDRHLEALREKSLNMLDLVLEAHGSTQNAKEIRSPDFNVYKAAERAYSAARVQYVKIAFARELKEYFEQNQPSGGQECLNKSVPEERFDDTVTIESGEAVPSAFNEMTVSDFSDKHETAIANNSLSMIDPQLLYSSDGDLQSILTEAVTCDPVAEDVNNLPAVSNGGLLVRIRQTKRSKSVTMAITILDAVSDELLRDEASLTESQLANLMATSFNNMFPSDNFFPGHEPLPGTTKCRFCEKDLLSCNKSRAVHSYWCAKKSLLEEIIGAADLECIVPETCSWVGNGPKTQGKVCGAIIATSPVTHLHSHCKTGLECRFGGCGQADEAILFQDSAELVTHIFKEHKFLCTNAVGYRRAEVFVWWCSSCLAWISSRHEDHNQHAKGHIPLINDIIHCEGYTGFKVYDINFRPIFCPFCLHDGNLPATIRFKDFCCTGSIGYDKHVLAHIKALDGGKSVCPAATSSADGILSNCSFLEPMDAQQLHAHLGKHHELKLSARGSTGDEAQASESSGPPTKKRNAGITGRRIALEPKPLNTKISEDIKAGKKASTKFE